MFNFVKNWFDGKEYRNWWKEIANKVKQAIQEVNNQQLGNAEKRELVADKINSTVNIPYIPEWIEELIIRGVIEIVYELIQKELSTEPKKVIDEF